jgi:probable blue pigment (indigoidine) exporter
MSSSSRHVLPLVIAAACWGLGAVASKRAVTEIASPVLLVIQLTASSAALVALTALSGGTLLPSSHRLRIGILGVLNPGLAYMLSLAGLASITVGLSVLIWSLEPILIMLTAWLVLRERLPAPAVSLSVVAVIGAAVAGAAGTGGADVRGIALTVGGVGCCAIYTVVTSTQLGGGSALPVVVIQQLFALGFAISAVPLQIGPGAARALEEVSGTAWASAVASGVLYYGLAFWAFLTGLRCTRPSTAAVFLNLIPLFGITAGWLLLGERMTPVQVLGAGVAVVAVVAMARYPHRSELPFSRRVSP